MSDNGVRRERSEGTPAADPIATKHAERRAINVGSEDALAKAFEMALTPIAMAGVGWLLDRWLGTAPIFLVGFAVFTFCYVVWKGFRGYDTAMRAQEAQLDGRTRGQDR